MAGYRRGRRGPRRLSGSRGASAFAPARGRGGNYQWEQLSITAGTFSNVFGALAVTIGTFSIRGGVLMPENLTRGTVTLHRIRGSIDIWHRGATFGAAFEQVVSLGIQLVPVQQGAVVVGSLLSPRDAGDLESNRWLWRRTYAPGQLYTSVATSTVPLTAAQPSELDVKSKRRFNRAMWALYLVCAVDVSDIANWEISTDLRGLFTSGDGM